jgi:hypothetical protein
MLRFIDEPGLIQKMGPQMPGAKSMDDHALEMVEVYKTMLRGQKKDHKRV